MTKIEWTDQTWNPTTGCTRVSAGCDNCYMFAQYPRLKAMGARGYELDAGTVQLLPNRLRQPYSWRKPRRVFVNSMSDLFHSQIPDAFLVQVFRVMAENPQHQFQVLTKRPRRAVHWWNTQGHYSEWPPNIWIGTSVESDDFAWRMEQLAEIPAKVRFVSLEPLLGPIDLLSEYITDGLNDLDAAVNWVIAGGESGPGARPADLDWFREIRDACNLGSRLGFRNCDTPFFLKQLGGWPDKRGGDKALLDGRLHREFPDDSILR